MSIFTNISQWCASRGGGCALCAVHRASCIVENRVPAKQRDTKIDYTYFLAFLIANTRNEAVQIENDTGVVEQQHMFRNNCIIKEAGFDHLTLFTRCWLFYDHINIKYLLPVQCIICFSVEDLNSLVTINKYIYKQVYRHIIFLSFFLNFLLIFK